MQVMVADIGSGGTRTGRLPGDSAVAAGVVAAPRCDLGTLVP